MDEILVVDSGFSFILVSLLTAQKNTCYQSLYSLPVNVLASLGMVAPLGKATNSRTVRFVNSAVLTNLTGDNIGGGGWLSILPPT